MHRHCLSISLTILAALERFDLFPSFSDPLVKKDLTIHIVGACDVYEFRAGGMSLEEVC